MLYKEIKLNQDLSLFDSNLQEISIYINDSGSVNVKTIIKLDYPRNMYLKLIFKDVIDYIFCWNRDYIFYTIESYKLLKTEDHLYYCSFDPADRELSISKDDKAIILSRNIESCYSYDIEFNDSKKIELDE